MNSKKINFAVLMTPALLIALNGCGSFAEAPVEALTPAARMAQANSPLGLKLSAERISQLQTDHNDLALGAKIAKNGLKFNIPANSRHLAERENYVLSERGVVAVSKQREERASVAVASLPSADAPVQLKIERHFDSAVGALGFQYAKADVSKAARLKLVKLAKAAKFAEKIALTGRADPTGDMGRNQLLALGRAIAVKKNLIAMGVPSQKIQASGIVCLDEAQGCGVGSDDGAAWRRVDVALANVSVAAEDTLKELGFEYGARMGGMLLASSSHSPPVLRLM